MFMMDSFFLHCLYLCSFYRCQINRFIHVPFLEVPFYSLPYISRFTSSMLNLQWQILKINFCSINTLIFLLEWLIKSDIKLTLSYPKCKLQSVKFQQGRFQYLMFLVRLTVQLIRWLIYRTYLYLYLDKNLIYWYYSPEIRLTKVINQNS